MAGPSKGGLDFYVARQGALGFSKCQGSVGIGFGDGPNSFKVRVAALPCSGPLL